MKKDMKQLKLNDDGTIGEEAIEELEVEKVDYEKLDKVDLIRLCKEKDNHIKSYETERTSTQDFYNNEINNMNENYIKKIKEMKALINYYERKFELLKTIIDIEKEAKKDDTI